MSFVTESSRSSKKRIPFRKLYVYGYNGFRQITSLALGKGRTFCGPVEVDIDTQHGVMKVATSLSSAFILWGDGRVSVSGWIPGTTDNTGCMSDLFPGQTIQDISCVDETLMCITKAGRLLSWNKYTEDDSSPVEVEAFKAVSQVECGDVQSIVKMDDGSIGKVDSNSEKKEYSQNELSLVVSPIKFTYQVQSVDCGKEHVLLLTNSGNVFSFGGGSRGQLGNGNLESQSEPILIEALDGIKVIKIGCGGWHSAVISNSGDVYSWGWNKDGQVGVSDTHSDTQSTHVQAVPYPVCFKENDDITVVDVSCGSRHTAVVTSCGEVWTWGWGYYNQLGQGHRKNCFQPTKISSISAVSSVWCSQWNTFLLLNKSD